MNLESHVAVRTQGRQTTVRMTHDMASSFNTSFQRKYGVRGASRWVEEALAELLKSKDYIVLIGAGEANLAFEITRGITLTPRCNALLEEAIIRYRKVDKFSGGVGAQILRAAIRHRLAKEGADSAESKPSADVEIKVGRLLKKAASKK